MELSDALANERKLLGEIDLLTEQLADKKRQLSSVQHYIETSCMFDLLPDDVILRIMSCFTVKHRELVDSGMLTLWGRVSPFAVASYFRAGHGELLNCAMVCQRWSRLSRTPTLWDSVIAVSLEPPERHLNLEKIAGLIRHYEWGPYVKTVTLQGYQLSCSVEHLLEAVPSLTALELDRCGTWFSEESDLTPLQECLGSGVLPHLRSLKLHTEVNKSLMMALPSTIEVFAVETDFMDRMSHEDLVLIAGRLPRLKDLKLGGTEQHLVEGPEWELTERTLFGIAEVCPELEVLKVQGWAVSKQLGPVVERIQQIRPGFRTLEVTSYETGDTPFGSYDVEELDRRPNQG
mmetsp:Transcript_42479/g.136288  ORF Transcript_42479/g.136288 Transcript_42479/m.136288 type:complete len:347 (-) Transcript_42479:33-1073(-)|eukprot:CAMPEP_0182892618 /NCGR_PEP_ID=MMETSP0034_2-20130328/23981_1 /TAXON_ID=156128 /ORGANISM="Nephroselmis pyriformis, Strain CCMP717" /LENGTH=346 /DNA_ID=CAMNT_0025026309 /DNA_START=45 /DNA_END=1085 /DNA_ORIENTATION=-